MNIRTSFISPATSAQFMSPACRKAGTPA